MNSDRGGDELGKCRDMTRYEYKCVAAPRRTKSFKGVRSHEDLFAAVLAEVMNEMAAKEWEYLRAESLPCEEKSGLTSRVEGYQSVLVFRRQIVAEKKFFEVPPTRQIELHKVAEDKTEPDVVFTSSTSTAPPAPIIPDMQETEEPATPAGWRQVRRPARAVSRPGPGVGWS